MECLIAPFDSFSDLLLNQNWSGRTRLSKLAILTHPRRQTHSHSLLNHKLDSKSICKPTFRLYAYCVIVLIGLELLELDLAFPKTSRVELSNGTRIC